MVLIMCFKLGTRDRCTEAEILNNRATVLQFLKTCNSCIVVVVVVAEMFEILSCSRNKAFTRLIFRLFSCILSPSVLQNRRKSQ